VVETGDDDPVGEPAFDQRLELPGRRFTVESVDGSVYFERVVPAASAHVRLWLSDDREPDQVTVAVG
jgi:hypothetical protein